MILTWSHPFADRRHTRTLIDRFDQTDSLGPMNSAATTVEPPLIQPAPHARPLGDLKIVAIYDGFEDGIRVNEALDWVDLTLSPDLVVRHCALSFAMLGRLDIRAAAVHEAADADVLLVAAAPDKELPTQVLKWLERCLAESREKPSALVTLRDEHAASRLGEDAAQAELTRLARRWGLEFITDEEFDDRMNVSRVGELLHHHDDGFDGEYEYLSRTPEGHYGGLSE